MLARRFPSPLFHLRVTRPSLNRRPPSPNVSHMNRSLQPHFRETHMATSNRALAPTRLAMSGLAFLGAALVLAACTDRTAPTTPTSPNIGVQAMHLAHEGMAGPAVQTMAADMGDKGLLDGWFNGETVQLYYTKAFFCVEPPDSGAASHCEVGADADTAPRPGPIPTIYAIA